MNNQEKWSSRLIDNIVEKIKKNEIVPIVGPNVYSINGQSVQEAIITRILNDDRFLIDESEKKNPLLHRKGYRGTTELKKLVEKKIISGKIKKGIRSGLREAFNEIKNIIAIDEQVEKFLNLGNFPLILSTCNFDYLSSRIQCGLCDYQILSYKKQKTKDDIQDIVVSNKKLTTPTIYHLFGTISTDPEEGTITEYDFLEYLHCIQDTGKQPKSLKEYLKDKYILSLGCEIPDWTFRFLLYSLKEKNGILKGELDDDSFDGGFVSKCVDEELSSFLSDICYFSHSDMDGFLNDINGRLDFGNKPQIFLSMCEEDYNQEGKEIKRRIGDRYAVLDYPDVADPQYWLKIKQAIAGSDYFIPVITKNALLKLYQTTLSITSEESKDKTKAKGIIVEWQMAREYQEQYRKDELFCIPYCLLEDYDAFKKAIEEKDPSNKLIWPLFFGGNGAEAFKEPLSELTSEKLKRFINRKD